MTVVAAWLRVEVRTRWRSLLVLALLVALASATVMSSVAGARRGASALDRLVARSSPADIVVLPNDPGFDWDRIRTLPGVVALSTFAVSGYWVEGVPAEHQEDVVSFPPADAEIWRSIERPVVLDGRLPEPTRADEVAISGHFRDHFDKAVGDRVTLRLFSPAQIDQSNEEGSELGAPEGDRISATVVGVIRSPWFSDLPDNSLGTVIPSPGLFARYPDSFLGSDRGGYVNALARLSNGEAGIADFKSRLATATGRGDIDVWDLADQVGHANDVTRFEARSLLAFALAAAVASLFLVGQAITRFTAASSAELAAVRSLGASRRMTRLLAVAAPTAAALAGVVVGAAIAVGASSLFPIGSAAVFEPAPGRQADFLVIGPGALLVVLLVAASCAVVAGLVQRPAGGRVRPAPLASAAAAAPLPIALGARFALDGGRGSPGAAVRPALLGSVVGIAGVIGALTFSAGVSDATSGFDRFGQTYELAGFFGFNGEDFGSSRQALETALDDPEVVGAVDARMDVAQAGEVAISLFTLDPVGRPPEIVLTDGMLPAAAGEIVLGPRTARSLHVTTGDHLTLTGPKGSRGFKLTGIGFVPSGPHNDYASGGWTLPADYDAMFDGFKFHFGLVDTATGADPGAVAERLSGQGVELAPGPIIPPSERAELRQVNSMPIFLAVFLAVLAIGAVGHMLASTVRRRRHDLAVLRALGVSNRSMRGAILTQAAVVAAIGVLIGSPLGAAIGRRLWSLVARHTPIVDIAPTAWLALILTPAVAIAFAMLLAVWPSHRARRIRVAHVLRSE